jgi:hypothetical protein
MKQALKITVGGKRLCVNESTAWLLCHLDGYITDGGRQYPRGICRTTSLPDDAFQLQGGKPGMSTLNGLLKRGWAFEAEESDGHKMGIYYITDEGRKVATQLKALKDDPRKGVDEI